MLYKICWKRQGAKKKYYKVRANGMHVRDMRREARATRRTISASLSDAGERAAMPRHKLTEAIHSKQKIEKQ